ncbi:MAG: acyltransferase family protein [Candidatus Daviesbacteria bacterium]|nr:acyltransferase family protein [Candidatus Daviesbacteria bacterium]
MKKYIFQADIIRALAIIGVIGIHLVFTFTTRPDFFGGTIWWIALILNSFFRMSVPLFVILSGYLTLGKPVTARQNLNRVFHRLLIPLFSYYIIFNFVYALMASLRSEPFDYWEIFHNLSKNTGTILYFLVVLSLIELLNPLWNLLTEKKNTQILKYTCWFFLILGPVAHIFHFLSLREGEPFGTFTFWMLWVGFYLYGYLVKIKPVLLSKGEKVFYQTMFTFGLLLTIGLGYLTLWLHYNNINDLFYIEGQTYGDGYISIGVFMMAISSFNLLMRSQRIGKLVEYGWIKKPVAFIAVLSFALFLNHLLVIDILNKFFGITPDSPSMPGFGGYLLINTFLTFIITIPLAFILQKTPIIKRIVGEK